MIRVMPDWQSPPRASVISGTSDLNDINAARRGFDCSSDCLSRGRFAQRASHLAPNPLPRTHERGDSIHQTGNAAPKKERSLYAPPPDNLPYIMEFSRIFRGFLQHRRHAAADVFVMRLRREISATRRR
ncbi:hypothetical protein [Paraburkholderia caribensis]|uniref:hypothetical protein n=1 Tax=Paraburkholderia caribensis TaxID=75105 RepID=UPI0031E257CB